eukprot:CAMPEP_0178936312 /NCGR_PEP_ID=MMETSP0786-20121207/25108_1 /TAXON_ID=186022 /ORGANISM="Thalassionema frauenfeldii, Strain CCMP 1798" /LENGTH=39 /DNA_ID= /DNA_START= /DNA_END= /DNA_ORIENTATION=
MAYIDIRDDRVRAQAEEQGQVVCKLPEDSGLFHSLRFLL